MAAALGTGNDYAGIPQRLVPRLRGILRHIHTLNTGMAAGLCALGKRFAEAGISACLVGSTAVLLGCQNPPRRHLWQTEIAVAEEDFPRAAALAEAAGFTVRQTPCGAVTRQGNTQCVFIRSGMDRNRQMTRQQVGSTAFLMPRVEDLLVELAEGLFVRLSAGDTAVKLLPQLMDLHCLAAAHPDWAAAAAAAKNRGTAIRIRLVLEVYQALASGTPGEETLALFASGSQTAELAALLKKYRGCSGGRRKLKRLWLRTRIQCHGTPGSPAAPFLKALRRAVLGKISRKR